MLRLVRGKLAPLDCESETRDIFPLDNLNSSRKVFAFYGYLAFISHA
jgi:hypothetical protein